MEYQFNVFAIIFLDNWFFNIFYRVLFISKESELMDKISFSFKQRTAIITGGAQGFGLDIAKRFLNSGAK